MKLFREKDQNVKSMGEREVRERQRVRVWGCGRGLLEKCLAGVFFFKNGSIVKFLLLFVKKILV